jgi:S-adenosylmethionine hydrolase
MDTPRIVALLTDFGLSDAYVGTMKGVMLTICPDAQLIDVTHDIQPQNVRQAAYVLLTAYRFFPPGTVFLVVVDPGVGTARAPIALATDWAIFVAPDNGVLSYVLAHEEVRHVARLENPAYLLPQHSQTFHGRDVFCPAAAHLANGVSIEDLGSPVDGLYRLDKPVLVVGAAQIQGEVLHIDHFGNIITSIGHMVWGSAGGLRLKPQFGEDRERSAVRLPATSEIRIGQHTIWGIRPTYGAVAPGEITGLVGSSGQLEIGMNQGDAAQVLQVSLGDRVTLAWDT